ncbi:MAG: DNA repair exonuclease [Longimicrobiales bacterium]|nr:DNA repair exonuclease [Longimicrobiales bacterium]
MSDLRLLCAADLHLGRPPSRTSIAGREGAVASAEGWGNLVKWAVRAEVDALLLAGDVIDNDIRSFEAWGPLEDGLAALREAGIPVVAVAGNHDRDVLTHFRDEVGEESLILLGAGGVWERWSIAGEDGGARLHLDGWSFPQRHHAEDPTVDYRFVDDGTPVVGLLHCDLDAPESRYAPVRSNRLRMLGPVAWVLGHIHAPRIVTEGPGAPLLYPGSLQALDPGERGVHGATLLEFDDAGKASFTRVPLSATHFDTVEVEITELDAEGAVRAKVREGLRAHLDTVRDVGGGVVRVASCRVRVVGRSDHAVKIEASLRGLEEFVPPAEDDLRLVVDGPARIETEPAVDLARLASGRDALGMLAHLILALDASGDEGGEPRIVAPIDGSASAGEDDLAELLELLVERARSVALQPHYVDALGSEGAGDLTPDSPAFRALVRRQATRLLGAVLQSSEGV